MLSIEEQIARIADAALECSLPDRTPIAPRALNRRPHRVLLAAAASLLLVMLVAGLALTVHLRTPVQPTNPPAPPLDPATVEYPTDSTWFVPAFVPDGLGFVVAEDRHGYEQYLRYESAALDQWLTVESGVGVREPRTTGDQIEIDGRVWVIDPVDRDPTVARWTTQGDDAAGISVSSRGMDEAVVRKVVESIRAEPATVLPRPPIPVGDSDRGIEVASAMQDGSPKRLFANTDGVSFVFSVDGGSGSSVRLGTNALVSSGALGPTPNLVLDGNEAESLLWGLLRSDVATVDIELTDGRVLSADAQDMSGLFVENFYFVAVPTKTDGGLEMVAAVVARARDGTELARQNGAVS